MPDAKSLLMKVKHSLINLTESESLSLDYFLQVKSF